MSNKYILIEALHPDVTRVAVVKNNILESLACEFKYHKHLRGNIYLGTVVRVESGLQAAFVNYGNGRSGFLEISDIHPDYFQPLEDGAQAPPPLIAPPQPLKLPQILDERDLLDSPSPQDDSETDEEQSLDSEPKSDETFPFIAAIEQDNPIPIYNQYPQKALRYNIQDVIHPNQNLLVQVIKEEHGAKGATLTTYLAIPGRYCILYPKNEKNKLHSYTYQDQEIQAQLNQLDVPSEMTLVMRQAASRHLDLSEIKADADHLLERWKTFNALLNDDPSIRLLHEEADLITRTIRDATDVERIIVDGRESYATIMRSSLSDKKIHLYDNKTIPLFHGIEQQIEDLYSPSVPLKSGGSIVINQTEALIAIDVNSGRSTQERKIEQTAFHTNFEAAEEIPRQIRLRDLGGLIVIDFIDMRENKNTQAVEKKFKEAMKSDQARHRVDSINQFGLLSLTRQRLGRSLQKGNFNPCPHCSGAGHLRTFDSLWLYLLRLLKKEASNKEGLFKLFLPAQESIYFLNSKQSDINALFAEYQIHLLIVIDETLNLRDFRLERLEGKQPKESTARDALFAKRRSVEINKAYGHYPLDLPQDDERKNDVKPHKPSLSRPKKSSPSRQSISLTDLSYTFSLPHSLSAQTVLRSLKTLIAWSAPPSTIESALRLKVSQETGISRIAIIRPGIAMLNFDLLTPESSIKRPFIEIRSERSKKIPPFQTKKPFAKSIAVIVYCQDQEGLWVALAQNRFKKWELFVKRQDASFDDIAQSVKKYWGISVEIEREIEPSDPAEIKYYLAKNPDKQEGKAQWFQRNDMKRMTLYDGQRRVIEKFLSRPSSSEENSFPVEGDGADQSNIQPWKKQRAIKKRVGAIIYRQDKEGLRLALIQDRANKWVLLTKMLEPEDNPREIIDQTLKNELGLTAQIEEEAGKNLYSSRTAKGKGLIYYETTYYLARVEACEEGMAKWFKRDEMERITLHGGQRRLIEEFLSRPSSSEEDPFPVEEDGPDQSNSQTRKKQRAIKKRVGAIIYRQDKEGLRLALIQDHKNRLVLLTKMLEPEDNPREIIDQALKNELGLTAQIDEEEVEKDTYSSRPAKSKDLIDNEVTYYSARVEDGAVQEEKVQWFQRDQMEQITLYPVQRGIIEKFLSRPSPSEEDSFPAEEETGKKKDWWRSFIPWK